MVGNLSAYPLLIPWLEGIGELKTEKVFLLCETIFLGLLVKTLDMQTVDQGTH